MQNRELRITYKEAIQLIRVGRYEEALSLLKDIDNTRPNVKNVLYPIAVCCERLGLLEEGIEVCDKLIFSYDHAIAREIKKRLEIKLSSIPIAGEAERPSTVELGVMVEPVVVPETVDFGEKINSSLEENITASDGDMEAPVLEKTSTSLALKIRKPIWLVILITMVSALIVAALVHVFILKSHFLQ